jgi:hypothetical protein
MTFQKGDIVRGTDHTKQTAWHPIVYLGDDLNHDFIGVILTKSGRWNNNIPLPSHFIESHGEDGRKHEFQYRNTHLVRLRLIKPSEWAPYFKIGRITPEGIEFIESEIDGMEPLSWAEYEQQQAT